MSDHGRRTKEGFVKVDSTKALPAELIASPAIPLVTHDLAREIRRDASGAFSAF